MSVVLNAARKSTNATFIYCARLACDARIPAKRIETCVAHTSRQSVVLVIIIFQKAKIRDLFFLESRLLDDSILLILISDIIIIRMDHISIFIQSVTHKLAIRYLQFINQRQNHEQQ